MKNQFYSLFTYSGLILVCTCPLFLSAQNAVSPENLKKGKDLYILNCQDCHGEPGVKMADEGERIAPDLTAKQSLGKTDGQLVNSILNGKDEMPSFKDVISESEIGFIIGYIRTSGDKTKTAGQAQPVEPEKPGDEMAGNPGNIIPVINEEGKALYEKKCKSCHTIGGGDRMGPDLQGISEKRRHDWLKSFIRSSNKLISSGDKDAVESFEKFKKKKMPDFNFSDKELDALLAYFSGKVSDNGPEESSAAPDSGKGNPEKGREYFEGTLRFAGNGVSCIACHDVNTGLRIPGGRLAAGLTYSFRNSGGYEGLRSILESPPFPSMNVSYEKNPLTAEEIDHLIAFLETASATPETTGPQKNGFFRFCGLGTAALLLLIMSIVWKNRKKKSVNKEILSRQKGSYGH